MTVKIFIALITNYDRFPIFLQPWCRLITTIYNYFVVTNFFWMFVEGCYLHTAIVMTYSTDKLKKWVFLFIGWCKCILINNVQHQQVFEYQFTMSDYDKWLASIIKLHKAELTPPKYETWNGSYYVYPLFKNHIVTSMSQCDSLVKTNCF